MYYVCLSELKIEMTFFAGVWEVLSRDLEGDGGGEVVILLAGSLQQWEPHDDPNPVLCPTELALEAGVVDHGALARCEVEGEALILEPSSTAGLETAGLEKDLLQSEVILVIARDGMLTVSHL